MSTLAFYAQFTKSLLGVNSLTVTWDIEQITRSDGTRSALVTGGATSIAIGRRGLYGYLLASADTKLYDYVATAITAGDVDQKEIAALWTMYEADTLKVSGDGTAADNLELFFDGTGYASAGSINSVSGSIGGNVEGKVLGGGSGTITGVGASTDVTKWKGDVPRSLDVSGNVMASATIADKRMSGFVGASGVAEAIAFDATMSPGFIGQSSVPYSPGILYDNAFINWTFVIEDGNSGIAFATVVTSSDSATNTLSLRDPIPDPGFVVEDDIAFLLLPFAPFENALTAQETANAVHNLAPVGVAAAGSMGANLDSILNGLTGVGLLSLVYTVTVTGTATPIEGVTVEVYTEEACLNCVRRGVTNSFGVVTFWMSTAGTYWIKCAKDGYEFDLDSETVSA